MVFWALSIATALFVALQYPFGWTADRFGRKPQMLAWQGSSPCDRPDVHAHRARRDFGSVLLVFCFGLGLYAMFASIAPAIMSELFPTELRGLGIGAWYNLTVAVFGGTAPLVIQWLGGVGHSTWFWYVAVGAVIAFVAAHAAGDQGVGAAVSHAVDLLADLVRADTVARDEARLAESLAERLLRDVAGLGDFEPGRDRRGPVRGRTPLTFTGHLDTVPATPSTGASTRGPPRSTATGWSAAAPAT